MLTIKMAYCCSLHCIRQSVNPADLKVYHGPRYVAEQLQDEEIVHAAVDQWHGGIEIYLRVHVGW